MPLSQAREAHRMDQLAEEMLARCSDILGPNAAEPAPPALERQPSPPSDVAVFMSDAREEEETGGEGGLFDDASSSLAETSTSLDHVHELIRSHTSTICGDSPGLIERGEECLTSLGHLRALARTAATKAERKKWTLALGDEIAKANTMRRQMSAILRTSSICDSCRLTVMVRSGAGSVSMNAQAAALADRVEAIQKRLNVAIALEALATNGGTIITPCGTPPQDDAVRQKPPSPPVIVARFAKEEELDPTFAYIEEEAAAADLAAPIVAVEKTRAESYAREATNELLETRRAESPPPPSEPTTRAREAINVLLDSTIGFAEKDTAHSRPVLSPPPQQQQQQRYQQQQQQDAVLAPSRSRANLDGGRGSGGARNVHVNRHGSISISGAPAAPRTKTMKPRRTGSAVAQLSQRARLLTAAAGLEVVRRVRKEVMHRYSTDDEALAAMWKIYLRAKSARVSRGGKSVRLDDVLSALTKMTGIAVSIAEVRCLAALLPSGKKAKEQRATILIGSDEYKMLFVPELVEPRIIADSGIAVSRFRRRFSAAMDELVAALPNEDAACEAFGCAWTQRLSFVEFAQAMRASEKRLTQRQLQLTELAFVYQRSDSNGNEFITVDNLIQFLHSLGSGLSLDEPLWGRSPRPEKKSGATESEKVAVVNSRTSAAAERDDDSEPLIVLGSSRPAAKVLNRRVFNAALKQAAESNCNNNSWSLAQAPESDKAEEALEQALAEEAALQRAAAEQLAGGTRRRTIVTNKQLRQMVGGAKVDLDFVRGPNSAAAGTLRRQRSPRTGKAVRGFRPFSSLSPSRVQRLKSPPVGVTQPIRPPRANVRPIGIKGAPREPKFFSGVLRARETREQIVAPAARAPPPALTDGSQLEPNALPPGVSSASPAVDASGARMW